MCNADEDQMVSIKEAAEILGISERTVRRYVAEGLVKSERRPVKIEVEVEKIYLSFKELRGCFQDRGKYTPKKYR